MQPIQALPELDPVLDSVECALSYPVLVGKDARLALTEMAQPFDRVVCLVDARVKELHASNLAFLDGLPCLTIPGEEASKDWKTLAQVCDFLAESGCSRRSLLVCVGGGVTTDLGAFAASIFKRGMATAHVPTTLLAQVDASIGGKTAINLPQGKNLAGTFHAPQFVLTDPIFLSTLDKAEWQSGLGEMVKTALLARAPLWQDFTHLAPQLKDPTCAGSEGLTKMLRACIQTKAQWVQSDPTEQGSRKALNLGHSFAHAIEKAAGFGTLPHGLAVAMGLPLAVRISQLSERLLDNALPQQLGKVLTDLDLPTRWSQWTHDKKPDLTTEALNAALAQDKKGTYQNPRFVLPLEPGRVIWDVAVRPRKCQRRMDPVPGLKRNAKTDR